MSSLSLGGIWEALGFLLEVFLWYFGKCAGGKEKGQIEETSRIGNIEYTFCFCDMFNR